MDAGLLILRVVFGLVFAAHGGSKLFGWFGGHRLAAVAGYFESLGFRPGRFFAAVTALTELTAGALIALGFAGPIGPGLMVSVMIVAAVTVHAGNGLFAMTNGIELPLLNASAGAALALTGPGQPSLDAVLGLTALWSPLTGLIVLAAAIAGSIGMLSLRRVPALAA